MKNIGNFPVQKTCKNLKEHAPDNSLPFKVLIDLYIPEQVAWCVHHVRSKDWTFVLMMRQDGEDSGLFEFLHESDAAQFALTWS